MKHTLNKTIDSRFHKYMLNIDAMQDIKGEMDRNMYGHLETRQFENGIKYNENYIHKWRTHSTQD